MKYKKELKALLKEYNQTNNRIHESYSMPYSKESIEYLNSKHLVKIRRYVDGGFSFTLEDSALTFFDDKKSETIKFWLPVIISNVIALSALVVSIFAYIKK